MSTLAVLRFPSVDGARAAARTTGRVDLGAEDVGLAIVSWDARHEGPHTEVITARNAESPVACTFWGLLFGVVFYLPLLGAARGAAAGAPPDCLVEAGLDDSFLNRVRDGVTPGTSALFVLATEGVLDLLRDAVAGLGPTDLTHARLSDDQEAAVRAVFAV